MGGLLIIGLYKLAKMSNNRGTDELIESVLNNRPFRGMIAPVIFVCTTITHLFGGSAGREGAALQLGGGCAALIAKVFRIDGKDRKILTMSGMSAVFSGLFGTPLTATLFSLEFESIGTIFSPAILPCFLSAFTANRISAGLGVHAETALFDEVVPFTASTNFKILILSVAISVLSIIVCASFHKLEHLAK